MHNIKKRMYDDLIVNFDLRTQPIQLVNFFYHVARDVPKYIRNRAVTGFKFDKITTKKRYKKRQMKYQ